MSLRGSRGEAYQLMNRVLRELDARVYAALRARRGFEALRPAYLAVMRNMNPHGSRITDIARRAGLTKQAVGLLVKDIEAVGYVEVVDDPTDARARLVRIPKSGWKRHEEVGAIVGGIFEDLERRIGGAGMASLIALLRKLVDEPAGRASTGTVARNSPARRG